jgi:transcriptional regulator with XRE-family HTH domain
MNVLFAKNLKFLRTQEKLSQEQFASKIGLNRGNIASYEKGTAEPNMSNLLKIVKYFNIDLSDIVEKDLTLSNEFSAELMDTPLHGEVEINAAEEQMIDELEDHAIKIGRFMEQSNDMQKILEGFRSFYQYKKAKGQIDMEKMVGEYEDLLEIMESLLQTNSELITFLEPKKKN